MIVAGFTSTGSKRPEALFGPRLDGHAAADASQPRAARSRRRTDATYLDFIMALGAVALGYGHPEVNAGRDRCDRARHDRPAFAGRRSGARRRSAAQRCPGSSRSASSRPAPKRSPRPCASRGSPPGATACSAAAIMAGSTGAASVAGVPSADTRRSTPRSRSTTPKRTRTMLRAAGDALACVVIEPVIDDAPGAGLARRAPGGNRPSRRGADFRRDQDGVPRCDRRRGRALGCDTRPHGARQGDGERIPARGRRRSAGKSCATLPAPGSRPPWRPSSSRSRRRGPRSASCVRTACRSTSRPPARGCSAACSAWRTATPGGASRVAGIPQMCYLRYADDAAPRSDVATECARRGLLFKRTAYNFVSLAHDDAVGRSRAGEFSTRCWPHADRRARPLLSAGRRPAPTGPSATPPGCAPASRSASRARRVDPRHLGPHARRPTSLRRRT